MNRTRVWQWVDFFLILCTWTLVFFTCVKIVPAFAEIFARFGTKLPLPARIAIHVGHFMHTWWVVLACLGGITLALFQYVRLRPAVAETGTPPARWERYVALALIGLGALVFVCVLLTVFWPPTWMSLP
jgi:hypothetical protein